MLQRLGRYELHDILGQGGMATVYRGYDPLMGREVAVKVLIPILARDEVFRTRFEAEIRAISQLEHPAIVPIYDAGEEEGHLYLVMRLMEDNLRNRLKRQGPLPFPEALSILQRVGAALHAAHQAGIIHRDVKPSNVLFDRYGVAYLTDFGIARLASMSETLTGSQLMGTPTYMSPEQIEGRKDIDHRADIYALGVLVFHMLAGRPPFEGDSPSRVMFLHLTEPPPNVQELRPDAPEDLQTVLEKALAKRPEERFATTQEFVEAFAQALEPVLPTTGISNATRTHITVSHVPLKPPAPEPAKVRSKPAPLSWRLRSCFWTLITTLMLFLIGAIVIGGWLQTQGQDWADMAATLGLVIFTGPTQGAPTLHPTPTITLAAGAPGPPLETTQTPGITPTSQAHPLKSGPTIFGADRVAFVWQNDIWSMTTDGQDRRRHTSDGIPKRYLAWQDATYLMYTSKNCAYRLDTTRDLSTPLFCLEKQPIQSFLLSTNGQWAALLVDEALYLFRYLPDLFQKEAVSLSFIKERLRACVFQPAPVDTVLWGPPTEDGQQQLLVRLIVPWSGRQGHSIERIVFSQCPTEFERRRVFPLDPRQIRGFRELPYVPGMAWNGLTAVFVTPLMGQPDWGHLYGYLNDQVKRLNPLEDRCCYRLPTLSPDEQGVFLIFGDQTKAPYQVGVWDMLTWEKPKTGWQPLKWPRSIPLADIQEWAWRKASSESK